MVRNFQEFYWCKINLKHFKVLSKIINNNFISKMDAKPIINVGFEFLKKDIAKLEAYLLEYADSLDGILSETVKNTLIVGGKRIRPALFLICARNENYNIDYLLPAAASIEIIHTASLIHDDLIDKWILRRGRKTNLNQDEQVYFEKIKEKTASLFRISCVLGGILSKSSQKDIDNMRNFGEYAGISFQINDDLIDIDISNSAIKVGKPVGNDLKQGDITLPLIYALKNIKFKKVAESILCQDNISDNDIKAIFEMLMQTGAIEIAKDKFSFYLEKAAEIVNSIEGEERREGLTRGVESIRH